MCRDYRGKICQISSHQHCWSNSLHQLPNCRLIKPINAFQDRAAAAFPEGRRCVGIIVSRGSGQGVGRIHMRILQPWGLTPYPAGTPPAREAISCLLSWWPSHCDTVTDSRNSHHGPAGAGAGELDSLFISFRQGVQLPLLGLELSITSLPHKINAFKIWLAQNNCRECNCFQIFKKSEEKISMQSNLTNIYVSAWLYRTLH
jgi:hypothetical protein